MMEKNSVVKVILSDNGHPISFAWVGTSGVWCAWDSNGSSMTCLVNSASRADQPRAGGGALQSGGLLEDD